MIDSLRRYEPTAAARRPWQVLGAHGGTYVLVTLHRPSNVDVDAQLRRIVAALCELAQDVPMLFPIHPRTRERLRGSSLLQRIERAGVRAALSRSVIWTSSASRSAQERW